MEYVGSRGVLMGLKFKSLQRVFFCLSVCLWNYSKPTGLISTIFFGSWCMTQERSLIYELIWINGVHLFYMAR